MKSGLDLFGSKKVQTAKWIREVRRDYVTMKDASY